jgi:hypothetical protein
VEQRAATILEFLADGSLVPRLSRDPDGSVLPACIPDPAGAPVSIGCTVEGTDTIYSAPGASTVTTLRNDRDQPSQLLFHDAAGGVLSQVLLTYDAAGRLVEESQTLPVSMAPDHLEMLRAVFADGEMVRRSHTYDERGRRVETRTTMGPLSSDCRTVAYNELGDPVEDNLVHVSRELTVDENGRLSETPNNETMTRTQTRFRYEYDARGNWLTRIVESRAAADACFTVWSTERRVLEYFD